MGNNGVVKVVGMGDVCLETNNGMMLLLKNVKHILDIRLNLSSAVDNENTTELWHRRLGHMSEKGLMVLTKKNLLSGMKNASLKKCAHCLAGKQNRVAFKTFPPSRKPDDHSRKLWVYTLKTKDQVLDVFKQFQASVERHTGKKLKCIRTDNGGEYCGPFDEYCKQLGIRHKKNTSEDSLVEWVS
ncbi:hypothetical protein LWI29_016179 [Acer saccharum]|uniref:GAG-pre-integrase domain-containing protein n=1 Tax=Acer saccharum TaxID=4024 RepID=A0AA39T7W9_ACESA|nr:hypothetical protein LWI29_016179 [Acer saccharum]